LERKVKKGLKDAFWDNAGIGTAGARKEGAMVGRGSWGCHEPCQLMWGLQTDLMSAGKA